MTPFQESIARALHALSERGVRIYLMHGNRDFMIGQTFCYKAGCKLLADPSVVQLCGEPVLLMHGDSLCTRDEGYMRLRRLLRNPSACSFCATSHSPLAGNWPVSYATKAVPRRA